MLKNRSDSTKKDFVGVTQNEFYDLTYFNGLLDDVLELDITIVNYVHMIFKCCKNLNSIFLKQSHDIYVFS